MQELTQNAAPVQTAAALRIVEAQPTQTVDLSEVKLSLTSVVCQLDLHAFFTGNHLVGLEGTSAEYQARELSKAREHIAKVIALAQLLKASL